MGNRKDNITESLKNVTFFISSFDSSQQFVELLRFLYYVVQPHYVLGSFLLSLGVEIQVFLPVALPDLPHLIFSTRSGSRTRGDSDIQEGVGGCIEIVERFECGHKTKNKIL